MDFVFDYLPSLGFAPIHEEMQGRNLRIKNFYHKLWFNEELIEFVDVKVAPIDIAIIVGWTLVIFKVLGHQELLTSGDEVSTTATVNPSKSRMQGR